MRFKTDENLPLQVSEMLRIAGFESETIVEENLAGAPDETIGALLQAEQRLLSTLDVAAQDKPTVLRLVARLIGLLQTQQPDRELWIVEPDRIRVRRATGM